MFGSSSSSVEIRIKERILSLTLKNIQSTLLWLNNKDKKPRYLSIYKKNKMRSINIFFLDQKVSGYEIDGFILDFSDLSEARQCLLKYTGMSRWEDMVFSRNRLVKSVVDRIKKDTVLENRCCSVCMMIRKDEDLERNKIMRQKTRNLPNEIKYDPTNVKYDADNDEDVGNVLNKEKQLGNENKKVDDFDNDKKNKERKNDNMKDNNIKHLNAVNTDKYIGLSAENKNEMMIEEKSNIEKYNFENVTKNFVDSSIDDNFKTLPVDCAMKDHNVGFEHDDIKNKTHNLQIHKNNAQKKDYNNNGNFDCRNIDNQVHTEINNDDQINRLDNNKNNIHVSNNNVKNYNNGENNSEERIKKAKIDKNDEITLCKCDFNDNEEVIALRKETEELCKLDYSILTPETILDFIAKNYESIYLESNNFAVSTESIKIDYSQFKTFTKNSPYYLLSLDCEMVMTEKGHEIGRISLLDHKAELVYDKIIRNKNKIIDYLTEYSGLTSEDYKNCISFEAMHKDLEKYIGINTVILGHGLFNDLHILQIHHKRLIDTSFLFRSKDNHRISLRVLTYKFLGRQIQKNRHCSIEDARSCLELLILKIKEREDYKTGKMFVDFGCEVRCCALNEFDKCKNIKGINIYEGTKEEYEKLKINNNYKSRFMMIFYQEKKK
ncbi:hypothetical protein COBT_001462, partial [Conglomerata obtusa]